MNLAEGVINTCVEAGMRNDCRMDGLSASVSGQQPQQRVLYPMEMIPESLPHCQYIQTRGCPRKIRSRGAVTQGRKGEEESTTAQGH